MKKTCVATIFAAFFLTVATIATAMPSTSFSNAPDEGGTGQPNPGTEITLEAIEGQMDTITFHIGAPVFLRLIVHSPRACQPFNGKPFYYDANGAQHGWGFREITDSVLFPITPGTCERIVMLSSESSNRLAEGYFTFTVAILIDEKNRLVSDTIVMHPIHSPDGADEYSYTRFLQEQIVKNSPLLSDPETMAALFSPNLPAAPESEIYRAVILYREGDMSGANQALQTAAELQTHMRRPLFVAARKVMENLKRELESIGEQR